MLRVDTERRLSFDKLRSFDSEGRALRTFDVERSVETLRLEEMVSEVEPGAVERVNLKCLRIIIS